MLTIDHTTNLLEASKNILDLKSTNPETCNVREESKITETFDAQLVRDSHLKLAMIGNVDSGKSTLVGVLTKGLFDDGRGAARSRIFNFRHEAENGRTSSIAQEIMGFNEKGDQVLPDRFNQNKNRYWAEVVKKSSKIVTILDLCGHEKYLKTTMFGLTGLVPDYTMIIVGANMGISRMTKEHLGITLALKIPFFVVVTKMDMCPESKLKETMDTLMTILKSGGVNRRPMIIKSKEDIQTCAENLVSDRICPIFTCSSVNGTGIPEIISFISQLNNRDKQNKLLKGPDDLVEFDINENFMVSGIGLVVSGLVKAGTIKPNTQLLLGPDKGDQYKLVSVKSIHVNRVVVNQCTAGEFACLAIRPTNKKDILSRDEFRKGMVLVDPSLQPEPIWEFEADVVILHHSTTIQEGYQSVVHCGVIRQSVKVDSMTKELMRTGDKGLVRFRFMYNSEYMKPNCPILLREGRTKILGMVTRVIDSTCKDEKPTNVTKTTTDKKDIHPTNEISISKAVSH